MKLSHIVPTSCLEYLPAEQEVHLALANLVVRDPKYREFYARESTEGKTVILDNPVHEYVHPHIEQWRQAIKYIKPSIAVLPDVIESSEMTVKMARWAMGQAQSEKNLEFMGVPHGVSDMEYMDCAQVLVDHGCTWIGISLERRLNDDEAAVRLRSKRTVLINTDFPGVKVHYLGTSERGSEISKAYTQRHVQSADTSKFAVWWLNGSPQVPPLPLATPYPGRAALGGSMEYFEYDPTWPAAAMSKLTRNLVRWLDYAKTAAVLATE